ncbi:unnamed protein product [Caenorhabditis bovis]|uniref:protein-tyrosine-phosphatase n=1 Tax=Caenorhabditis bovis TaxID=2654633 RepID=A0A8S1F6I3_9PELO|nr:unnamed protein product [Caenorhabditis bovis]
MSCRKVSPPSSRSSTRPQTVRSRAGSTPGLDNSQIHAILNKKSFATLLCKNNDNVDSDGSYPPTRSMSVVSMTSVLSPSSIDTTSTVPRFIKVAPARDSQSVSSHESNDSALELSPRKTGKQPDDKPPDDGSRRNNIEPTTRLLYLNEIVWKIDDTVYAAGNDAATNMSLLCRLNIEFVCEIVDESTEHIHQNRRQARGFDCPCLCPRQLNHFRYFVSMDVPETEQKCIANKTNMQTLFDQFIELVERGRRANKNVLVCSTRGRNRAPTFCAAYLMHKERISRWKAVATVTQLMGSMRPPVNISDFMQRSLMRYQSHLGVEPEATYDSAHSVQLSHVKRSAWT